MERRQPFHRRQPFRPHPLHRERDEADVRGALEEIEIEPRRQQPAQRVGIDGPMQEQQVAPLLPHDHSAETRHGDVSIVEVGTRPPPFCKPPIVGGTRSAWRSRDSSRPEWEIGHFSDPARRLQCRLVCDHLGTIVRAEFLSSIRRRRHARKRMGTVRGLQVVAA